jgi:hypothetical protein
MAATTSLIIAGASAAAKGAQAIAANKRRKEADFSAKSAAAKLRGISETDYSAGLQVPTMGYDLAQEGVQQQVATGVQALQDTGAAGVIGGLPTLTEQSNRANLELGADLQNQEYQRDLMRAQTRQSIEGRKNEREYDIASGELMGAQAASSENRQIVNQSVGDMFGALSTGYGEYLQGKPLYNQATTRPTIGDALAPFQAPPSRILMGGKDVELGPVGTKQYLDNKSYAPGQSPFGSFTGLQYKK